MGPGLRKKLGLEVEPQGKAFPRPVFIVGCMRSGTTFLVDKLTQHPQLLKIGAELRDIWTSLGDAPSQNICMYKDPTEATGEQVSNMTHYLSEYIRSSKNIRRHLMRAKAKLGKGQNAIFYDWDHIRPVNKSTRLINKITYAHALFPQAQIIFIIRDIFGHSASMKSFINHNNKSQQISYHLPATQRDSWHMLEEAALTEDIKANTYPGNFEVIPKMWLRLNMQAMQMLSTLPPESYRIVTYEDTVQQQEKVLLALFEYLNLEEKHRKRSVQIARSIMKYKNTSTQGDPLSKWKKDLSEAEIDSIHQLIKTHQAEYDDLMAKIDQYKVSPR